MMDVIVSRGATTVLNKLPMRSIALDGYVQGPEMDLENQRFSFDHHDGCVRLVTRATCQQVMDALLLGFDPRGFTIYINDVDGDTTLAVWLLQNYTRVTERLVRRLVETVGALDAHGPAYPVMEPDLADAFFQGVMKPVNELHRSKEYGKADLSQFLATCVNNIDKLITGELEWAPRSPRSFEITHTGTGSWVMARSDEFIFDLLYAAGYTKAIAYQQLEDGSFAYTVGKKSELVSDFPVGPHSKPDTILYMLNKRESGWGGGSTIGGAPRNPDGSRSRLTPDEVFNAIERLL